MYPPLHGMSSQTLYVRQSSARQGPILPYLVAVYGVGLRNLCFVTELPDFAIIPCHAAPCDPGEFPYRPAQPWKPLLTSWPQYLAASADCRLCAAKKSRPRAWQHDSDFCLFGRCSWALLGGQPAAYDGKRFLFPFERGLFSRRHTVARVCLVPPSLHGWPAVRRCPLSCTSLRLPGGTCACPMRVSMLTAAQFQPWCRRLRLAAATQEHIARLESV
jgi:hypothetical protein